MSVGAVRVRTSTGWRDLALTGPPGPGAILASDYAGNAEFNSWDWMAEGPNFPDGQRVIAEMNAWDLLFDHTDPNTDRWHMYWPANLTYEHGNENAFARWEFRADHEKEMWECIGGGPLRLERHYDSGPGQHEWEDLVYEAGDEWVYCGPGLWIPWPCYMKVECGSPLALGMQTAFQTMIGHHDMVPHEIPGFQRSWAQYTLHGSEVVEFASLSYPGQLPDGGVIAGHPFRHQAPANQGYYMLPEMEMHDHPQLLAPNAPPPEDIMWDQFPNGAAFVGQFLKAFPLDSGMSGIYYAWPWLEWTPTAIPFDAGDIPGPNNRIW
jgi:hypothetical protein